MSRPASRSAYDGLDHVVVNAMRDMDAAAETFTALGFRLTPRGHHSLGSINHLMMTRGPYLELVGVPELGLQRRDVLDSPFGLNGLVIASGDADASFARLSRTGLPVETPATFSRPVTVAGRTEEARFRTVRFPAHLFPAGRIYYCEHLTPDLVWRPEWFAHPNGFNWIDRVVVTSRDPEAEAVRYAAACNALAQPDADGWSIRLGDFHLHVVAGGAPRFFELGLRFDTLEEIERRARALPGALWLRHDAARATLTLAALDLLVTCRSS
ncbi:VOC family protein [Methylobacterium sp. E-025]|uniref:VOC family protein n=1 Tax=Methylobacterium sp. E-025 TaxID=2836561 RepID=UPI001FB900DF|nr:VOC family protein [Methylobacterium sp. E-025]MCJ2113579.1 VOC family protein [Methylobacterium sp. E-025]